ncbi:hypothetical protein KJ781_02545 [Patescibacteria group bacterium]|nr:hypothetical protein [Patescibacteria group bacterium]MBU1448999.1 hypothetical protein [Patescibacteria group bacterium]MBU2613292.1 hypothetical protein [Patescibacteria group bacterium]
MTRPAVLNVQKLLQAIFPNKVERDKHRLDFVKGKVLIREGEVPPFATAFLVVEGELDEEQLRATTGEGQKRFKVARIMPGALANRQGLLPSAEKRQSDITIRAVTDGVAYLVTDDVLHRIGADGELLVSETIVRKQFYDIIAELQRALAVTPEAAYLGTKLVEFTDTVNRRQGLKLSPRELLKQMWEAFNTRSQAESKLAESTDRIRRIEANLKKERKAGAQARTSLRDYMEEVDTSTERQTLQANETFNLMQSVFRKIGGYLAEQGVSLRDLEVTPEEINVFSGFDLIQQNDAVGITCPPGRIRGAPTVLPCHEAPPSTGAIPLVTPSEEGPRRHDVTGVWESLPEGHLTPIHRPFGDEDDPNDPGRETLVYDAFPFSDRFSNRYKPK